MPEGFYDMRECEGGYRERTRANARSGDATLILSDKFPLSGGTAYTVEIVTELSKPLKVINLDEDDVVAQIRDWMLSLESVIPPKENSDRIVLNVAGPRESVSPGIFSKAKNVLLEVFSQFRNWSGGDLCAIDDDGGLIAWMDAEFVSELESKRG